jgi:hypothetical protein
MRKRASLSVTPGLIPRMVPCQAFPEHLFLQATDAW